MDFWLKQTENEMRLLNYSRATIKNYLRCLKEYFAFAQDAEKPTLEEIKKFLLEKRNRGCGPQTANLYLNAITFFNKRILKNSENLGIKFAKRPHRLPIVLSRDEILRVIEAVKNRKHKLMIALAYSAGLRVSEVVNLKIYDVQIENLCLHIRQSKGNRDRITIFSERLRDDLIQFMACKKSDQYLFESERDGRLASRTAQKIFESAIKKAGIIKPATFHSLRHSFATHLIEDGVNLRYVQELLGHKNIRTTQIYTQVSTHGLLSVKSPL